MLTLYLLRHAKSDWSHPDLVDFDRPLSPRGVQAADAMATYIHQQRLRPTRILCSSACRTRHSLLPLLSLTFDPVEVQMDRRLYDLSEDNYLDIIRQQGTTPRLMLIGHNMAIQETAQLLIGAGDQELVDDLCAKYPTGALTDLCFDEDHWSQVMTSSGHLIRFVKPRNLLSQI